MEKRSMVSLAVTVGVGLAAVGFSSLRARSVATPAGEAAAEAAPAGPPASPEELADEQLSTKMNLYIDCVNKLDPMLSEARKYYVADLTPEGQINPKRLPVVREITQLEKCYEGLAEAIKLPPKLPDVETSAAAYKAAVDALVPIMKEGNLYYQQNDYKDDAFARGQALHTQILSGFERFGAAREALHDAIDKYNQQMLDRSLARVEKKEGKSLRYYARRIMNDANTLLDQTLDAEADPALLSAGIDRFKTTYAEMMDLATKNPAKVDLIRNWSSFTNYGNLVLRDFKEVQRAMKEQQAADAAKPFVVPKNTRESLLNFYNEMVEASNGLEFKSGDGVH